MVARLLYRDGLMLVIDKPAGFAVHKGPKGARGGESIEDHFDALRFGLPRPPALAHRLDRDTSGCLVLGRHRKALAELGKLFKAGRVGKTYWAVVEGGPEAEEGRIDLALGRLDDTRGWWQKVDPDGQPSTTLWKAMGRAFLTSPCKGEVGSPSEPGGGPHTQGRIAGPLLGSAAPIRPSRFRGGTRKSHLARARAADRAHPSTAGPLRGDGLADPRRHDLWHRAAHGWPRSAPACAGDRGFLFTKTATRSGLPAPVPPQMAAQLKACGWNGEDVSATLSDDWPRSNTTSPSSVHARRGRARDHRAGRR